MVALMGQHILILNVRREYFEQIKAGTKKEEYRRVTHFWISRISYKKDLLRGIEIRCGYPKPGDKNRIITFPWNGYEIKEIQHDEFGRNPTCIFAIKLEA